MNLDSLVVLAHFNWKFALSMVLLTPVLTYFLTSLKSAYALRRKASEQIPPIVPYWLPLIGNAIHFARDAPGFAAQIV